MSKTTSKLASGDPQLRKETVEDSDSGDRAGKFEDLFREYRSMLKAKAAQLLNNRVSRRVDASDIVQITYYEAYRDLKKFQGNSRVDFIHWLRCILSRNIVDVARFHRCAKRDQAKETNTSLIGDLESAGSPQRSCEPPEGRLEKQETKEELMIALGILPDKQREALELRYLQGASVKEISKHLRSTPSATARLMKRGLDKLRSHLKAAPSFL